jgi:hypothetical protein
MLNTAHGVGHGVGALLSAHLAELSAANRPSSLNLVLSLLVLFNGLQLPSAFMPQHSGAEGLWPALAFTGLIMEMQRSGSGGPDGPATDWALIKAAAVGGWASYPLQPHGAGADMLRSILRSALQQRDSLRQCLSEACARSNESARGTALALAHECAFALGLRDGLLLLMAPPSGGADDPSDLGVLLPDSAWEPLECMQEASMRCVYVAASSTFYHWFELLGPFDEACCFEPLDDTEWLQFFDRYCSADYAHDLAARHACEASARAPMTGLSSNTLMSAFTSRLCAYQ